MSKLVPTKKEVDLHYLAKLALLATIFYHPKMVAIHQKTPM
jgi:hypothetical protein